MPIETAPFDAADYLGSPEAQAEFLAAAAEEGDLAHLLRALDVVARARGLVSVAEDAGLTRQGLRKALGEGGDPKLSTVLNVARALGFQISFVPVAAE